MLELQIGPDAETTARWAENARRYRLLEGAWHDDLREHLRREYHPRRRRALGRPDTTKNLYRSVISQLSHLYDSPPTLTSPDGADAEATMAAVLDDAGFWSMCQDHQELVLGLQDSLLRFEVVDDRTGPAPRQRLQVRVVPPQNVWARSHADAPDVPVELWEWRIRTIDGTERVAIDVLDVSNPEAPSYRVHLPTEQAALDGTTGLGQDITEQVLGGRFDGDAYPYRYSTGQPVIPGVLYHRTRGRLWRWRRGCELADGALSVAGLLTQWKHGVRDASHPTRAVAGARLIGVETNERGDAFVQDDEAALLQFEASGDGQVVFHQWGPGADVKGLLDAIQAYAQDLSYDFDISPSDITRTHTDARSGYAISISRKGQRDAMRKFQGVFAYYDAMAVRVIAAVVNSARDMAEPGVEVLPELSEAPWSVRHQGLPLTDDERRLVLEGFKLRAELGATSLPALVAELEGISEDAARQRLREYRRDAAEFGLPGSPQSSNREAPPMDGEE